MVVARVLGGHDQSMFRWWKGRISYC
jgi:hypothetical protein